MSTIEMTFADELEEQRAIAEFNRQRVKTFSQKMREVEVLKAIEAPRAKQRMVDAHAAKQTFAQQERGTAGGIVARATGIGSGEQLRKAEYVYQKLLEGDPVAVQAVTALDDGKETITGAYRAVRKSQARQPAQEVIAPEAELPSECLFPVQPGDLVLLGAPWNRLACGDATNPADFEHLMLGDQADLVVTDPLYGVGRHTESLPAMANDDLEPDRFEGFLKKAFANIFRFMRAGAVFYIFAPGGPPLRIFLNVIKEVQLTFRQLLTWVKPNSSFGRSDYHWRTEQIIFGSKPGAAYHRVEDRTRTTVLEYPPPPRGQRFDHLSPKPLPLIEQLIEDSSSPRDIVLDPFGGTGSTLIAAQRLDRDCYMMEIDPKHCQTIIDRFQREFPGRLVITRQNLGLVYRLAYHVSEKVERVLASLGWPDGYDIETRAIRLTRRWCFEDPGSFAVMIEWSLGLCDEKDKEEAASNCA